MSRELTACRPVKLKICEFTNQEASADGDLEALDFVRMLLFSQWNEIEVKLEICTLRTWCFTLVMVHCHGLGTGCLDSFPCCHPKCTSDVLELETLVFSHKCLTVKT